MGRSYWIIKTDKGVRMTSKEALETVKDYLLQKLKEDNSELGSIIIVESVNVLEKLVEQAQKQEQLLELYKEYFEYSEMLKDGRKFGGRMLVEHERDKIIEEIKELEKEIENDK